ncbi:MAG: 3-oxoadipate enol-lactonase [Pseudomonadota bacterium]
MRIAALEKVRLHWRVDGDADGLPVLFANSLGTDLRLWDEVVALLPRSLRLIRYDLRGHGLSSCPPGPYSIADLTDDAEQLLAHLGITSCVFVGMSLGGMIGQSLAARRPDLIQAMVLSNTAPKMGDGPMWQDRIAAVRQGGLEAAADPILERWFSPAFREAPQREAWRNMLARTPCDGYVGCCEALAQADLSDATAALTLPVLVVAGSDDRASPPETVRATAALIAGAEYVELQDVGHLPSLEAPRAFAEIVTEFIGGQNGA